MVSASAKSFLLLQSDGNLCVERGPTPYLAFTVTRRCLFGYSLTKEEVPLTVSHAEMNEVAGTIEIYGYRSGRARDIKVLESSDTKMFLMQTVQVCETTDVPATVKSDQGMMSIQIFDTKKGKATVQIRCQDGKWKTIKFL